MRAIRVALAVAIALLPLASEAANTSLSRRIYYGLPSGFASSTTVPSQLTVGLDTSGEKLAYIFVVDRACTLGYVDFKTVATSSAQDLKVSFQDVSTSNGDPDGTVDQFRVVSSIAANTTFRTGLMTSDGTDGGSKRSVSIGDVLSVVIEFNNTTGNVTLLSQEQQSTVNRSQAYVDNSVSGTWTKTGTNLVAIGVECDDSTFLAPEGSAAFVGVGTTASVTNAAFSNASNPEVRGNKFTLPYQATFAGFWAWIDADAAATLVLYDSDGTTQLATASVYNSNIRFNANGTIAFVPVTSTVALSANTAYRVTIEPSSASTVGETQFQAPTNAALASWYGTNFYRTTKHSTTWTDTDSAVTMIGPVISAIGTGGGVSKARVINGN